MKNHFDTEPWQRRGEGDLEIARLRAHIASVESDLAAIHGGLQAQINTVVAEVDALQAIIDPGQWDAWDDWNPVVAQFGPPTQTENWGTFVKHGRLIIANFGISFSTGGTAVNPIVLTGFGAARNALAINGTFRYFDAGNTNRAGHILGLTTTSAQFFYDGWGNPMGNGDFAIANGDSIQGVLIYESAA